MIPFWSPLGSSQASARKARPQRWNCGWAYYTCLCPGQNGDVPDQTREWMFLTRPWLPPSSLDFPTRNDTGFLYRHVRRFQNPRLRNPLCTMISFPLRSRAADDTANIRLSPRCLFAPNTGDLTQLAVMLKFCGISFLSTNVKFYFTSSSNLIVWHRDANRRSEHYPYQRIVASKGAHGLQFPVC